MCNLKSKLETCETISEQPQKHFNEIHLANELRCAHNHHQTRMNIDTHPLL
jgi:hypothetical protein